MTSPTLPLWPYHPKPYPDELLSSWLVRIAHGHGLKVQSFCTLIFGRHRQVWNRDIDRQAPDWLVEALCTQTAVNLTQGLATTLRMYEGMLYPNFTASGLLRWILPLRMHHRTWQGHGLQFCPVCLSRDKEPYFRRRWRVGFYVWCTRHQCLLHDRCPDCAAPVAFTRQEMGKPGASTTTPMCFCHACGFDLRQAARCPPTFHDSATGRWLKQVLRTLEHGEYHTPAHTPPGALAVLHLLCKLMTSRYPSVSLQRFVCDELKIKESSLPDSRLSLVMRPIQERFFLLQLASWLLVDPQRRLSHAWQARAVRYNLLLKDMADLPTWYVTLVHSLHPAAHAA